MILFFFSAETLQQVGDILLIGAHCNWTPAYFFETQHFVIGQKPSVGPEPGIAQHCEGIVAAAAPATNAARIVDIGSIGHLP